MSYFLYNRPRQRLMHSLISVRRALICSTARAKSGPGGGFRNLGEAPWLRPVCGRASPVKSEKNVRVWRRREPGHKAKNPRTLRISVAKTRKTRDHVLPRSGLEPPFPDSSSNPCQSRCKSRPVPSQSGPRKVDLLTDTHLSSSRFGPRLALSSPPLPEPPPKA